MADQIKKHFLAKIEEEVLNTWESEKTFEESLENRKDKPVFSFFDGPPFANGIPHYGHLEQATIKDTITRYKTMKGFYVPRRVGWDTHGLPVEYAIEQKHGFKSKKDIIKYGIEKFNQECRESVFEYKDIWEKMFRRIGRWADYDKTYSTLDDDYIESVWWVFKSIFDKGLIYKDFRSSPYCPRCATPLSNFELNLGYKDNVEDPSLFVKFKIKDQDAYLLGWTTTPWSLPGNAAIAVKPEADYVYVNLVDSDSNQNETLVIAKDRLEILSETTYNIIKELKGNDLIGLSYKPLFKLPELDKYDNHQNLYKVWGADFVSINDGSGVLHVAPAFGEDDLLLSKQQNLPVLITIDENGHVKADLDLPKSISGKFFKQVDNPIIEILTRSGNVYEAESFLHTYPFCWRCDTPLLYYATDSWLVNVTAAKDQLIANNQQISWTPKNIKDGRFGKWLEQARDWAISRNRFWGAPLPVWITEDGEISVIGSIQELKEMAVDPTKISDLHRPFIDDVVIKTKSGKLAHRITEVFDCWFESGSMPYAEDHYPFENDKTWEERFPADFIAEAIDQTRGWFYTLHVLATVLFDKPAYENVICSGWIVAADGEKLSKRKKNYAPMDDVFDQYGVDTLRFFIATSPLMNGEDTRFSVDFLKEVQRKVFMTFNNTFNFYELYAKVDDWKPSDTDVLTEPKVENELDKWLLSRVNQTILNINKGFDIYRLDKASRPIIDLLDDLSNWFVRRSRRRFWKSQDDNDKQQAYKTLHFALLTISQLLAPFAPFLADYVWRKLTNETLAPKSVHLSEWPIPGRVDENIINKMAYTREAITQGLAQRAREGIKVRQPLGSAVVYDDQGVLKGSEGIYAELISDELNVKQVSFKQLKNTSKENGEEPKLVIDTRITTELHNEGLVKEVLRSVQNSRKLSSLNVSDRIVLNLRTDDKLLTQAISDSSEVIKQETLAVELSDDETKLSDNNFDVDVEGIKLHVGISKS